MRRIISTIVLGAATAAIALGIMTVSYGITHDHWLAAVGGTISLFAGFWILKDPAKP